LRRRGRIGWMGASIVLALALPRRSRFPMRGSKRGEVRSHERKRRRPTSQFSVAPRRATLPFCERPHRKNVTQRLASHAVCRCPSEPIRSGLSVRSNDQKIRSPGYPFRANARIAVPRQIPTPRQNRDRNRDGLFEERAKARQQQGPNNHKGAASQIDRRPPFFLLTSAERPTSPSFGGKRKRRLWLISSLVRTVVPPSQAPRVEEVLTQPGRRRTIRPAEIN
jgi:hypothetical protein